MMNSYEGVRVVIEKHDDGFVAFAKGIEGVVVGQGDTFCQAFSDIQSAIRFHVEVFGPEVLLVRKRQ